MGKGLECFYIPSGSILEVPLNAGKYAEVKIEQCRAVRDALHLEERYTRSDPDTITYEVIITDPKVFSRPWKMSVLLYRHKERNFRILEYECHAYAEDAAKEQSR